MDEQLESLMALFEKREELHPDLVPHLRTGPLGTMLHHPLIINIVQTPMHNAHTNAMYEQKTKALASAAKEGNWAKFVFLHERPYRLEAILSAIEYGIEDDPKTYWGLVGSAWTDSENINESINKWIDLWEACVPERVSVMDEAEREALQALPQLIRVYRGYGHAEAVEGLSWTTDEAKARWFAKRFSGYQGSRPHLATGMVDRNDVIAHFLGRNESEIVVLPESVMDIEVIEI
jgi:hypothetical protein